MRFENLALDNAAKMFYTIAFNFFFTEAALIQITSALIQIISALISAASAALQTIVIPLPQQAAFTHCDYVSRRCSPFGRPRSLYLHPSIRDGGQNTRRLTRGRAVGQE